MIVCRSAAELERMRDAGRLVGEVLTELASRVAPGVSTAELDELAEKRITRAGATPAFKGYHGYPATICASINEEVIHGIPSGRRVLQAGRHHLDRRRGGARRVLRRQRDHAARRSGIGRGGDAAARDRRGALQGDRAAHGPARAYRTSVMPFSGMSKPTGSRWCASSSGTASASGCTKSRRCPTTVSPGVGRGWPRAWCSRSSRW